AAIVRREAMRVVGGGEEARAPRVVARALEVGAEIALPAERQIVRIEQVRRAREEAAVLPARVEDFTYGAVVILGIAEVRLREETRAGEASAELDAQTRLGYACANRRNRPRRRRLARVDALRARRDDAADSVGSVRHRTGAA